MPEDHAQPQGRRRLATIIIAVVVLAIAIPAIIYSVRSAYHAGQQGTASADTASVQP
ncbi:MAG TPA: hypothetical protein VFK13_05020 [Gemmatimonadaceae bacterium]|nr:hypothetical protein [Gemmatimonadaceae bacterium]